jgi:two-component system, OmpR family, sensor histidine kinase CiaH
VFFWWWILLFQKNDDLFREKIQLLYYRYQDENSAVFVEMNDQIEKEYRRQRWMIIGEGATFIILLSIGIYRLRRTIMKEIELANRQRNFLLSITHELKSPLASAQLNLQTISKRSLTKEQTDLLIGNTTADITRLNELVEKILLASRMDHENMQIDRQELNLSELTELCGQQLITRFPEAHLSMHIQPGIFIMGDVILLKSLINNLLENALKYSPVKSLIEISLSHESDYAVLDVSDNGKSIPEEEKEKIFERFYRIGNEETRTSTGVGLGLFIVQQVAFLHHGKVDILDKKETGKIFRVTLPLTIEQTA